MSECPEKEEFGTCIHSDHMVPDQPEEVDEEERIKREKILLNECEECHGQFGIHKGYCSAHVPDYDDISYYDIEGH